MSFRYPPSGGSIEAGSDMLSEAYAFRAQSYLLETLAPR